MGIKLYSLFFKKNIFLRKSQHCQLLFMIFFLSENIILFIYILVRNHKNKIKLQRKIYI